MAKPTARNSGRGSDADAVADKQRELQLEQDRKDQAQSGKSKGKEKSARPVQDGPRLHPASYRLPSISAPQRQARYTARATGRKPIALPHRALRQTHSHALR